LGVFNIYNDVYLPIYIWSTIIFTSHSLIRLGLNETVLLRTYN